MKRVEIYTDGACKGNPGPGGYGAILVYGGQERVLSGGSPPANKRARAVRRGPHTSRIFDAGSMVFSRGNLFL